MIMIADFCREIIWLSTHLKCEDASLGQQRIRSLKSYTGTGLWAHCNLNTTEILNLEAIWRTLLNILYLVEPNITPLPFLTHEPNPERRPKSFIPYFFNQQLQLHTTKSQLLHPTNKRLDSATKPLAPTSTASETTFHPLLVLVQLSFLTANLLSPGTVN